MTIILFLKLIYVWSCIGMLHPSIEFYKKQGFATVENALWTIFLIFTPIVNTVLILFYLIDKIEVDNLLEFKIWESKR